MNKGKEIIGVIRGRDIKAAIGHQAHVTGTGVHKDKRTKRCRTRQQKNRKALQEWKD